MLRDARQKQQLVPAASGPQAFAEGGAAAHAAPPRQANGWESKAGFVRPGNEGFNEFARGMLQQAGVPSNERVLPPADLLPAAWVAGPVQPRLQPYQETVAFLAQPESYANPRMLVVHRTGSGKTATMIQVRHATTIARAERVQRPRMLAARDVPHAARP